MQDEHKENHNIHLFRATYTRIDNSREYVKKSGTKRHFGVLCHACCTKSVKIFCLLLPGCEGLQTGASSGIDKIRINPGNIGDGENVRKVAEACRAHRIPIRIGVNAGSF